MSHRILQVDNILNGSVRSASKYRETDGWRLPMTTEDDVSFALKCVRLRREGDFSATLRGLAAIGEERDWIRDEDLREIAVRTGSPIRYLRFTIDLVNRWLSGIEKYVTSIGITPDAGWFSRHGMGYEGGLTTALILAGDDTSLAPWVLAHTAMANANVIVKSSSVEPLTSFLFAKAMLAKGIKIPALLSFDTSSPDAVAQILRVVASSDQSIVFGEDRTIRTVYDGAAVKPPHKAIAYYSGRSGAIVYEDADLALAARDVVFGATMDRGNKCVSTKKVWIPRHLASKFEELLSSEADKLKRGDPLDATVVLGKLVPYARELAEAALGSSRVVYDRDLVIAECDSMSRLVKEELPYPIVGLCLYGDDEDPIEAANASVQHGPTGRALVMSVFSRDIDIAQRAAGRLRATKVLWNAPTVLFDYQTSHQGMHLCMELVRPRELVMPSPAMTTALTQELMG
jgi:hypothetical protein